MGVSNQVRDRWWEDAAWVVYRGYPNVDLLPVEPPHRGTAKEFVLEIRRVESTGDTLFEYLVLELGDEGGEIVPVEEYQRRIEQAQRNLESVWNAVQAWRMKNEQD